MAKITFLGAGSTIFAKNVLGDTMLSPALHDVEIALYDIDAGRLEDSYLMLSSINNNCNQGRAVIKKYFGTENRREALRGAKYVVNAVQIGGYDPCTIIDFEVPKKYGLRQTIGDSMGIPGIFRALRTLPVLFDVTKEMEQVCPDAWFLNYTNPMGIITGALLRYQPIKTVGLCHSVQVCTEELLTAVGMENTNVTYKIAGINHMGWLLEIERDGVDLYPEIKRRAKSLNTPHKDMVRFEIMKHFGYYVTESSEHNAEYMPYWIKNSHPELITQLQIPLDEYPRRCIKQMENWKKQRETLVENMQLTHERTLEYASYIIEAMETNVPYKIGGNVINHGCITNLPDHACVEIPCLIDASGVTPCYVGALPEQLAALNRTNINVQLLAIEAAVTHKKEAVYHAAMLDPHASSELTLDEIKSLCDDLIEAHGHWIPRLT